jgi:hypothetical protein
MTREGNKNGNFGKKHPGLNKGIFNRSKWIKFFKK